MGTYVVTGGASGIGAAIKQQLQEQGHRVLVVDIQQADITANLATAEGRAAALAAIRDATADGLDGLVCSAGVGAQVPDKTLITGVNYFGTVDLVEGLRDVLAASRGSALLVSSNSAPMETREEYVERLLAGDEAAAVAAAGDMPSQMIYSGSKRAVAIWMRRNVQPYAQEGVRLNAVAPGYTRTPLTAAVEEDPTYGEAIRQFVASIPIGRPGLPQDMADAASFLLSDRAAFICGVVLFVDGGHDAMMRPDKF